MKKHFKPHNHKKLLQENNPKIYKEKIWNTPKKEREENLYQNIINQILYALEATRSIPTNSRKHSKIDGILL